MKTYNKFINESIRDKMLPKSEDEIENSLKKFNPIERLIMINQKKIPDIFKPSDEELKNYIKNNLIKSKIKIDNNRYFLGNTSKFEPSDEELKKYIRSFSIPEQLKLTNNTELIYLKPDTDDIIKYLVSLSMEERKQFIEEYNIFNYLKIHIYSIGRLLSDIFINKDGYIPLDEESIGKFINTEKNWILLNIDKSLSEFHKYYINSDKLSHYFKK
jgi:hypothetical protein